MRQLTDSERDYLIAYWFTEPLNNSIAIPERFKEGFIAARDHSAAQIAALTAANTRLREAQFKAVKDLKRMARDWRTYAAGDYCQTYNPEMGSGFRRAAGGLEDYVNEAWRGEER